MDKLVQKRLRRRGKIFIRCVIGLLLAALFFWGLRPESLFQKPQYLFDNSWWLDLLGHFFIFLIIGFIAIYESRFVLQSTFRRTRTIFFEGLGWGAGFEIAEFGFDNLIHPLISNFLASFGWWLDTAQKGLSDTMLDLIADGGGVLAALLLWGLWRMIYAFLFPTDSRKEYLAERAELVAHYRAAAKKLEREHHQEIRQELRNKLKKRDH